MKPVGLANTRISTGYAQKSPQSLVDAMEIGIPFHLLLRYFLRLPQSKLSYTKYGIQCHQFELSCSILNVNHSIVSPTLNVNPTLFVIPHNFKIKIKIKNLRGEGCYRFTMLLILSLTKSLFHPNFNHPGQYFIASCSQEKVGFLPMDELIHHPPSTTIFVHLFLRSVIRTATIVNIKHHMTLYIILASGASAVLKVTVLAPSTFRRIQLDVHQCIFIL